MRKDEISSKAAKDEDEEEGELTTTKKRIIIKEAACYDGSKEQQPGMIIEAIALIKYFRLLSNED